MPEPISIESSTAKENRISFFEHRNKIIGTLFITTDLYRSYIFLLPLYTFNYRSFASLKVISDNKFF